MSSLTRWINPKERKEINPLTTKQDARFIIKRFAGHFLLVSGDYSYLTRPINFIMLIFLRLPKTLQDQYQLKDV